MPNQITNYGSAKPLAPEFYDAEVQNGNMDKIDVQMKTNVDGVKDLQDGQKNKVDLMGGKTPAEQPPITDYEAKGTTEQIVTIHDGDKKAYPYLLGQIETCVTAAQNAQDATDTASEAMSKIAFTINAVPTQSGVLTYDGQA